MRDVKISSTIVHTMILLLIKKTLHDASAAKPTLTLHTMMLVLIKK
jgi:hypothetical protein